MTGYSLHIGLNDVDPNAYPPDWDATLFGCHNDAHDMESIANSQGFQSTRLLDAQASSSGVLSSIASLARTCGRGDIALITYSGHGGQVPDSNGDEDDGQDETWVLWDRQVSDDELHAVYRQFPAGSRIVVISDSCHSGTVARSVFQLAMRDAMTTSGEGQEYWSDSIQLSSGRPRAMPVGTTRRDAEDRADLYRMVQSIAGPRRSGAMAAELILLAGCQDDQFSYDGSGNGAFTGALKTVWRNGAFRGNYEAFLGEIRSRLPGDQVPNYLSVSASAEFQEQRPFTVAPAHSGGGGTGGGQAPDSERPTLRRGDSGHHVRYLQQKLVDSGAHVSVDGDFGAGTFSAVKDFQASRGLVSDGVVGPATWAALHSEPVDDPTSPPMNGPTPESPASPTPVEPQPDPAQSRPTLRKGDRGEDVTYLQERLASRGYWLTADGHFGAATESAVRSFQRSLNLTADGVVGAMTWGALG